ncbi:MAG TPA: MFS transporter [Solirubrobacteraceae bacterium]|nr:MFS transporter [Solirubrobacteraceae bacterium]
MAVSDQSVSPRRARRSRRRSSGEPLPRSAWTRLAACTAAAALLQLDGTVITVALPSVAHDLHVTSASTALILSAYFAAYALLLFPGGRLVDRFGARPVALFGLVVFAVGAALGAVVSDLGLLVGTRVIQGVGAGLVSPAALAGAVSGFPADRRGGALGIWGASAGMANLVGPLLGGLLTVAFGWRAAWWALVPLALLAAWGIAKHLPSIVHELGAEGRQRVLSAQVGAAACVAGLTFAVMIGTFYLAEQYLQRSVGYSALGASAVLILVALLVGAAAPLAGGLVDRRGERLPAVLGFTGAGVGLVILAIPGVSLHGIGTIFALVPVGLGLGLLFVPTSRAALNATEAASHGRVSAILSAARLVGAAVGAGLAGVALASGPTASTVHLALAVAAGACLLLGLPVSTRLGAAATETAAAVASPSPGGP